jgi:hypothetical protein
VVAIYGRKILPVSYFYAAVDDPREVESARNTSMKGHMFVSENATR